MEEKYDKHSSGRIIGIQQYELVYEREGQRYERHVLVKSKQSEQELMGFIAKMLLDHGLDEGVSTPEYLSPAIGFEQCDRKELEI